MEFARIGQTPWTPPISILFALDVALERYHAEGMQAAFARHARNARNVRAALQRLGFALFSQPGAHSDTVVAACPPPGVDPALLLRQLREKYGVVLSGGQGELSGKDRSLWNDGSGRRSRLSPPRCCAIESSLSELTSGVA